MRSRSPLTVTFDGAHFASLIRVLKLNSKLIFLRCDLAVDDYCIARPCVRTVRAGGGDTIDLAVDYRTVKINISTVRFNNRLLLAYRSILSVKY